MSAQRQLSSRPNQDTLSVPVYLALFSMRLAEAIPILIWCQNPDQRLTANCPDGRNLTVKLFFNDLFISFAAHPFKETLILTLIIELKGGSLVNNSVITFSASLQSKVGGNLIDIFTLVLCLKIFPAHSAGGTPVMPITTTVGLQVLFNINSL